MRLRLRTARHYRGCANCHKKINKGEKFFDTNTDGGFWGIYAQKYCQNCVIVEKEVEKNLYECELQKKDLGSIKCGECDGTGSIQSLYGVNAGMNMMCSECDGAGKIYRKGN